MASLTLKDIPDDVLERLRALARRERRSLVQQAIVLLDRGLAEVDRPDRPPADVTAQVARWRELAGRWESDQSFEDEVEGIVGARTRGRAVDP